MRIKDEDLFFHKIYSFYTIESLLHNHTLGWGWFWDKWHWRIIQIKPDL